MTSECVIVFIEDLKPAQADCLRDATAGWTKSGRQVRIVRTDDVELPCLPSDVVVRTATTLDARNRTTAVVEVFAAGTQAVAIVNESALDVPADFIDIAFEHVAGVRALAIGPSAESFYLIAANDLFPDVVALTGENEKRFDDLLSAASEADSITILPAWP